MDEVAVEVGVAGGAFPVFFHKAAQPLPGFGIHGGIGFPLIIGQIHGRLTDAEFFLRFLPALLQFGFLLPGFFCLAAHGFQGYEIAVENPVKGDLLFPGFGIDCPQGGFDRVPVGKIQADQNPAGIRRFLGTYRQSLQPEHPGEDGHLFQIDLGISHRAGLRRWGHGGGDDGDARRSRSDHGRRNGEFPYPFG